MNMMADYGIELAGKNAVVIGRSNIVGKPVAAMLTKANATVTICHSKTKDLAAVCANADILVAAIGKPKFVTKEFVRDGAVVIDVGINRVDGKLCGDVDFEAIKDKCSYITPVPFSAFIALKIVFSSHPFGSGSCTSIPCILSSLLYLFTRASTSSVVTSALILSTTE